MARCTNTELSIIKEGLDFEAEFHVDQAGFTFLRILTMTLNLLPLLSESPRAGTAGLNDLAWYILYYGWDYPVLCVC